MDNDPNISSDKNNNNVDPRGGAQGFQSSLDERSGRQRSLSESVENIQTQDNAGAGYPGPDVIESDIDDESDDEDADDEHPSEPDEDDGLEENVDEDEDLPGADQNQQPSSR